jgi:hypothetical protein
MFLLIEVWRYLNFLIKYLQQAVCFALALIVDLYNVTFCYVCEHMTLDLLDDILFTCVVVILFYAIICTYYFASFEVQISGVHRK